MPAVDVGLTITAMNNATRPLKDTADDVRRIGENAQATANRLKAIQVVIAGIAIEKIRELTKLFLEAASATQLLDIRMAGFAGSAKEAQAVQAKLNSEFSATPFKLDSIYSSWIKLRAAMSNNEDAIRTVEAIVNAVATLPDASDQKIDELAIALQRMLSTGQTTAREFNAVITNSGLTIGDLAEAAGMTADAFNRELRDGFMNASKFIDAFTKASEAKFGNFAIKLGSTLGGAMKKIENDISSGLSRLGENTNINERLTLVFQHLDQAVVKFISDIKQGDIDKFFQFLSEAEGVAGSAVHTIVDVGKALAGIAGISLHLLNALPAEALEFGIIGYVLFGRKGFLIGALIGTIDQATKNFDNWFTDMLAKLGIISQETAKQMHEARDKSILDNLNEVLGGVKIGQKGGIFGADADAIAKIKRDLEAISGRKPNILPPPEDTLALTKALEAAERLGNDLGDAMVRANDQIKEMTLQFSGDELGAKIQNIVSQTDSWRAAMQNIIDREATLEVHTEANKLLVEALRELMAPGGPIDQARDVAIAKEQRLYEIKTKQLAIEQQIARMQIEEQIRQLRQESSLDPKFNVMKGTAGGKLQLDVLAQQAQLEQQVAEAKQHQLDIDEQIEKLGGPGGPNSARVDELEKTKQVYIDMGKAAEDALGKLSVEGQAAKELWQGVGQVLDTDVANGIKGLLEGTMTLGQVMHQIWSDITDLVIKYILKLIEAKIMQEAMAAIGFGFQDGGIFPGNVKPFANGDIITGPTLFGLAGEAGTEAIMPLTRIGGKLGVRAAGGGGATHIHINAIDTQTGIEFILKNADNIENALLHRRQLHRGGIFRS